MTKMTKMTKINSSRFRWDNSARANYVSITLLWKFGEFKPLCEIIGYCEGSSLSIAPDPDSYGVLFNYEDGEIWLHVSKQEFDIYLKNNNKENKNGKKNI